jgi:hypothetical protein
VSNIHVSWIILHRGSRDGYRMAPERAEKPLPVVIPKTFSRRGVPRDIDFLG